MLKLLLPLVALFVVALLAACADSTEEISTPTPLPETPTLPSDTPTAVATTETPTAEPTQETALPTEPPGGAGGDLPATVVPPPTPSASLPPVPEDWATFEDSRVPEVTFRYPSDWYVGPSPRTVRSWDYTTWDKPYPPPDGIRVDFDRQPLDPPEQIGDRPPEATDATLGGLSGWEIVRSYDVDSEGWARVHWVAAERNGYRYLLIGSFAEEAPDETIFLQIVNSFQFAK